jgi:glycyl-tRNA synthetase
MPADSSFPISLILRVRVVEVLPEHVKRVQRTENVNGEWYVPHVVEPAFGIDRIIWHLLDHSYSETEKSGEDYTLLKLPEARLLQSM